jgi:DNA (cytosine-5)-methyltransferase 1
MGYRFRLHVKRLPGKPDLVFPKYKKVIFVNGCFWHGHNCSLGRIPKSRVDFWIDKIDKNRARDEREIRTLTSLGWRVLVLWECELKDKVAVRRMISEFLEGGQNKMDKAENVSSLKNVQGEVETKSRHSVVSFFSGCGGLDLGFMGGFSYKEEKLRKLPFDIQAAYDFDEKCVATYKENIGDHAEVLDLAHADPAKLPQAEILIGGFPCQDFSSCGPKRGLSSQRGKLYTSLVSYMKKHKPMVVVGENVPHLAKIGNGEVIKTILTDFTNAGYRFEVWNLFAPDYGIPQNRSRLFFIGVRDDLEGMPKKPTPEYMNQHRSIKWAINDLEKIIDDTIPNQSQYFLASKAKKGNGQGDEKSRADEPSYTVRANAKSRVQFHYSLDRRLTVRECARLQTFPDTFKFSFSATTNVMQIGNAVPPLLAYQVAKSVSNFMTNLKKEKK